MNPQLTALFEVNAGDSGQLEKFREIRRMVRRHIDDEENKLFPAARKLLDGDEAKALAGEFIYLQDLRKNLMQPV